MAAKQLHPAAYLPGVLRLHLPTPEIHLLLLLVLLWSSLLALSLLLELMVMVRLQVPSQQWQGPAAVVFVCFQVPAGLGQPVLVGPAAAAAAALMHLQAPLPLPQQASSVAAQQVLTAAAAAALGELLQVQEAQVMGGVRSGIAPAQEAGCVSTGPGQVRSHPPSMQSDPC